jgi:hypothetical protein
MQRCAIDLKFSWRYGPDIPRKQRIFYHKYLRQAVMDVFNPPDGDGAAAFSLEQLKVAFQAVFREAMAKCLKEASNRTFNLPLKGNSNHLFFILSFIGCLCLFCFLVLSDKTEHGFKCRIDGLSSEASLC